MAELNKSKIDTTGREEEEQKHTKKTLSRYIRAEHSIPLFHLFTARAELFTLFQVKTTSIQFGFFFLSRCFRFNFFMN